MNKHHAQSSYQCCGVQEPKGPTEGPPCKATICRLPKAMGVGAVYTAVVTANAEGAKKEEKATEARKRAHDTVSCRYGCYLCNGGLIGLLEKSRCVSYTVTVCCLSFKNSKAVARTMFQPLTSATNCLFLLWCHLHSITASILHSM